MIVAVGSAVVFLAAFLGGLTGFGYGLVATPLLFLLGVHPMTAVAVNLAIAMITRGAVLFRLHQYIRWRRAVPLAVGSAPGLILGAVLSGLVDPSGIRAIAGTLVLLVAPILMVRRPRPGDRSCKLYGVAGFAGGVLGTSTSLNGVPVALSLSADDQDQRSFIADLALYFVLSNLLGLLILGVRDGVQVEALTLLMWWLPGALFANWLGTSLSSRLRPDVFRIFTCVLVMAAGVATLLSA